MKTMITIVLAVCIAAAMIISGCTQTAAPAAPVTGTPAQPNAPAPSADTVRTASSPLGTILTDNRGMTLYYFADDVPGSGASTCYGRCAEFWPIFSADPVTVSPPLTAADFSTITRTDGTRQTTYDGWPLYYFQRDTAAGMTTGENVQGNWSVAKPDYTLMYSERPGLGTFLTDSAGKTLYYFARESPGTVACTGTCLQNWPAFASGPLVAPSFLKAEDFAVTTRPDGTRQSLYKGMLLYYYAKDTRPGDTNGQGVGGAWYVANVTGYVPPPPPPPTTVPTPTPKPTFDYSDSSGSGGGGDSGGGGGGGGGGGY